jgi:hypothetical protein
VVSAAQVPQYELVDRGECWAAVRDGNHVFMTYDREADPLDPSPYGILRHFTDLVEQRWGRTPTWVQTDNGWRNA